MAPVPPLSSKCLGLWSQERADAFALAHDIEHAVGSVDALGTHPDVDVVYIAAPPSDYETLGLLAIAAGKHVLIEKPIATSAAEVRSLISAAASADVLVMESMWSRFCRRPRYCDSCWLTGC
jgi:predicted dehydrogenase